MKKIVLLAASAFLILASCTNNESAPEQTEITFKSYAQKSSKAGYYGPMTGATYSIDEHFGVFAFLNTGTSGEPVWASTSFMNNVEIERTGSESNYVWKNNATTYYWPSTGTLTFACYSPYGFMQDGSNNTTIVTADETTGISFSGFTAPIDNNEQIDLMVADLISDQGSTNNAVSVVFNHILSQIKFTAATTVDFTASANNVEKIVINYIKVHSLNTKGNYSSTDGTVLNGGWTDLSETETYQIPSKEILLDKSPVVVEKPLLVLPQDATGYTWSDNNTDRNIIEVNYTITFSENGQDIPVEKTVYSNPTAEWLKGYIYTYNLQIGLDEITFAPEVVEEWTDGGESILNN